METTESLVLAAVERFAQKLLAVGELKRTSKRQRLLLQEAAQEVMTLPRQLKQGEHTLPHHPEVL